MRRHVLSVPAGLLLAAAALGQPQPDPAAGRGPEMRAMNEDVEIMRRLLIGSLAGRPERAGQCASCHGLGKTGLGLISLGLDIGLSAGEANAAGAGSTGAGPAVLSGSAMRGLQDGIVVDHSHGGLFHYGIEGSYLKGHGVVYHITLPAAAREELKFSSPLATPRPVTEWEQVRGQLRGERATTTTTVRKFTLLDALADLMAENGKNFRHLAPDENLTLVVTIRGGQEAKSSMGIGMMSAPAEGSGGGAGMAAPSGGGPPWGGVATLPGAPGPGGPGPLAGASEALTPEGELELLGDLHLKRGNVNEAIAAYERALARAREIRIDPNVSHEQARLLTERANERLSGLMRKLAEAHLRKNDLDGARKALEGTSVKLATNDVRSAPRPPEAAAVKLPTRVTLTASKRTLDQAGSGTLPPAEFRKKLTLEIFDGEAPRK